MANILKYLKFCLIPLCFMLMDCGMMTSIDALLAPISTGAAGSHYTFRLDGGPDGAWADDGSVYVFFGIEIYYRIFETSQPSGITNLTSSSQLASNGFRRMYRLADTTDDFIKPVLYFENPYTYKTSGYAYLDFDCEFDDVNGILNVTIINDAGGDLETFELKRAVFFPDGHPTGPVNSYKGFNQFEYAAPYIDADITQDIWDMISPESSPPSRVWLMLYAYSFGFSLDPSHMWSQLESPLEYLGQLEVMCKEYIEP